MALFFNQDWFAARMAARHLTAQVVARALGLSAAQWRAVTCDQRELRAREVVRLAQLLESTPQEIAIEAGIGTPRPENFSAVRDKRASHVRPPQVRSPQVRASQARASQAPQGLEARVRALEARVTALEKAQEKAQKKAPALSRARPAIRRKPR